MAAARLQSLAHHLAPTPPHPAAPAPAPAAAGSAGLVAFCTHEGGPHVQSYIDGLRDSAEVGAVILADPTGHWADAAREALGDRLQSVHSDAAEMLAAHRPTLAIIAYEAVNAPPVIRAALEAGSHVLAEKPACIRAADMEELVVLAKEKERSLMLALANRVRPEVQKARELVTGGALGQVNTAPPPHSFPRAPFPHFLCAVSW